MKYYRLTLILLFLFSTQFSQAQKLSTSSRKAKKLYEEAEYHLTYGQYYEADEKLHKAVHSDPHFFEAFLLLGDLHADLKENNAAINYYKKSIAINPDFYPQVYYFIGKLSIEDGQYVQAEQAFKTFINYPDIDEYSKSDAERNILNCQFALVALQNPVDFTPLNMGENINSIYSEYFPTMNVEGNYILFTRRLGKEGQHQQEDFYVSITNKDGLWVAAQNMGKSINTPERRCSQHFGRW